MVDSPKFVLVPPINLIFYWSSSLLFMGQELHLDRCGASWRCCWYCLGTQKGPLFRSHWACWDPCYVSQRSQRGLYMWYSLPSPCEDGWAIWYNHDNPQILDGSSKFHGFITPFWMVIPRDPIGDGLKPIESMASLTFPAPRWSKASSWSRNEARLLSGVISSCRW